MHRTPSAMSCLWLAPHTAESVFRPPDQPTNILANSGQTVKQDSRHAAQPSSAEDALV